MMRHEPETIYSFPRPAGLTESDGHMVLPALFGCSDREIMAFTDHTTSKEVDRYTKGARQRIVAASAMEKLSAEARRARLRVS